jgi:hypothetical protein
MLVSTDTEEASYLSADIISNASSAMATWRVAIRLLFRGRLSSKSASQGTLVVTADSVQPVLEVTEACPSHSALLEPTTGVTGAWGPLPAVESFLWRL